MNTPVSFELSKMLKEKGYKTENCYKGWHGDFGDLKGDTYPFLGTYTFFENFLTRNIEEHQIESPTIAEVVIWLYEKHRIWISVYTMETWPNGNERKQLFDYSLKQMRFGLIDISKKPEEFNSPTEAYEASIEFTLKNLI